MTVVPIYFADPSNPKEVQAWLNANTSATVVTAFIWEHFFYIITNP